MVYDEKIILAKVEYVKPTMNDFQQTSILNDGEF